MAKKPTVTTVTSGYASTETINANTTALRDGFDNTLSLDGSTPNAMNADLDMNSNDVVNVSTVTTTSLKINGVNVVPTETVTTDTDLKYTFDTIDTLILDTRTYSDFSAGDDVVAEGISYEVLPLGTAAYSLATAGSVLFNLLKRDTIQPRMFGSVGDFDTGTQIGTNNDAAFARMKAWMALNKVGRVIITGNNLVTEPQVYEQFGVNITPAGVGNGAIYGDHTTGPIIQLRKSYGSIKGLLIGATTVRAAAAYSVLGCGIITGDFDWENPTSSPGASGAWCIVEQNSIRDQPGSGIFNIGSGGRATHNNIQDCKGHGLLADPGQIIGVTSSDLGFPGWSKWEYNKINDCGGHATCIGSPNSVSGETIYRFEVNNNDCGRNATDASVRYTAHQHYWVGEQISTKLNAAGEDTSAFYVAGRQHNHVNNRSVGTNGHVYEVADFASYGTQGINIDEFRVAGPVATMDPAVVIASTVTASQGVRVTQSSGSNITNIVASADRDKYAKIDYNSNVNYGGTLKVGDIPVLVRATTETFSPTMRFATAGDTSVSYATQVGRINKISDNLAYFHLDVVGDITHTTASGVLLLDISASGYTLKSGTKQALSISRMANIAYGGQKQLACYTNTGTTLRFVQISNGSSTSDVETTDVTSGSTTVLTLTGVLEIE